MKKDIKPRLLYAVAFTVLVAVEVLIALFVRDRFWRPYGGDIIVMGVLYCLVRIFIPKKVRLLPLYIFGFACLTEGAQALDIVSLLGLEQIGFFKILLGTAFSWIDIVCYAVGGGICLGIQEIPSLLQKK